MPPDSSTPRLVLALVLKGGAYLLLSVLVWPVGPAVVTLGPPLGAGATPLAGVAAVLAFFFAAAGLLAFVISAPRTPDATLRRLMSGGMVVAVVLMLANGFAAYDVISRNNSKPAAPPATTDTAEP
jgi:uncharacterized membrane protein